MGRQGVGLLALALAAAAPAVEWAVLPPVEAVPLARLRRAASSLGLTLRPVALRELPAGCRVAVLPEATAYIETIDRPGDGETALRRFLALGGCLVLIADGPPLTVVQRGAELVASPFPTALAEVCGVDGVVSWTAAGGSAEGERRLRPVGPAAGLPFWRAEPPAPPTPLVIGPGRHQLPVEAWLECDGRVLLARLRPVGGGSVVFIAGGLLQGPAARACLLTVATLTGEAGPPPALNRLWDRLAEVEAARGGGLGDRATVAALETELAAWTVAAATGEVSPAATAKLEQALDDALTASRGRPRREGTRPMVELVTSKGRVVLELFDDVAPEHVKNLLKLVTEGFYDGLRVHRVEPGFVVQVGCPYSRDDARDPRVGTGGPGYTIRAEFNDRPHVRGTLGMARSSSPDSAGSQFYICLDAAPFLDHHYTVFGQVTGDGMMVVEQLRVGDMIEKAQVLDAE